MRLSHDADAHACARREEADALIKRHGGRVTGGVTGKTSYLLVRRRPFARAHSAHGAHSCRRLSRSTLSAMRAHLAGRRGLRPQQVRQGEGAQDTAHRRGRAVRHDCSHGAACGRAERPAAGGLCRCSCAASAAARAARRSRPVRCGPVCARCGRARGLADSCDFPALSRRRSGARSAAKRAVGGEAQARVDLAAGRQRQAHLRLALVAQHVATARSAREHVGSGNAR
jgi:hypothetical protein